MTPPPWPDNPGLSYPPVVVKFCIPVPGPYDPARGPRREFPLAPPRRGALVEDDPDGAGEMCITRPVHEQILDALTGRPPEAGGMLLGPRNHHAVTHFVLDEHARATATSFTLDHVGLNQVLRSFAACAIDMKGFVHSHPAGSPRPSGRDIQYVLRTFANPRNAAAREFLLPIICGGEFFPYIVLRGDVPGSEEVLSPKLVLF
jgi:proteasome lid subunit RPN8/RPN11